MATSLGKVGIKNRGRFDASATYAAGEYVYYMGSTFIALQNLPAGMVPQHDGINWNFLAEGASVEQVLQNFAPIEDGATVSKPYPAGDYFLHEDVLYKTTTDIAIDGAIIIGTNVIQANIGEEMHALAKNFANEEDSATATTNYSVGQYVIYNEQFYKVTAAISAGQTMVPGTNIEATNVGTQLSALNDSLNTKGNTESLFDSALIVNGNTYNASAGKTFSGHRYLVFYVLSSWYDVRATVLVPIYRFNISSNTARKISLALQHGSGLSERTNVTFTYVSDNSLQLSMVSTQSGATWYFAIDGIY